MPSKAPAVGAAAILCGVWLGCAILNIAGKHGKFAWQVYK